MQHGVWLPGVGSAWWGGCPGRCWLPVPGCFPRWAAPLPCYRNNVALDATEVRVAGMADMPGASGHEEDSLPSQSATGFASRRIAILLRSPTIEYRGRAK